LGVLVRRRTGWLVAGAVAVALLASPLAWPGVAVADPAADRQAATARQKSVQDAIDNAQDALEYSTGRAQRAGAAYAEAQQQLPGAQQALAEAEGRTAAAQSDADAAARAADEARAALASAQAELETEEAAVLAARQDFSDFAAAAYKGADALSVMSVLQSRTPSDLADRMGYLHSVSLDRQSALDRVTRARLAAAQTRNTVAVQKQVADKAAAQASAALAGARDHEAEVRSAKATVDALVAQSQQALAVADQERVADQRQYAQLQEENAQIEADLARIAAEERRAEAARRAAARRAAEKRAAERRAAERRAAARLAKSGRSTSSSSTSGSNTNSSPTSGSSTGSTDAGDHDPGAPSTGSGWLKPVAGYKSSDFGSRYDPYYHRWQLHAGTDFAAPAGTPIHATKAGRVIRAGWNGGYGNYTCISHGHGVASCYGHQSAILVGVGQYVSQGQVIGRVGTTGASTGNHLHFEIRINGRPVNPLGYL
jgi:murein DD-endopeptidase MepM/ murein hydrolase activator NlpD